VDVKLEVRVHPGAGEDRVVLDKEAGHAEVWTRARPENNQANLAVLKLLARHLGLPVSCIRLVSGQTSRKKVVLIPDTTNPKPKTANLPHEK